MERLTIKDFSWGIDRKSGERKENIVEEIAFQGPFKAGDVLALEQTNKKFEVVELKAEGLEIVYSMNRNIIIPPNKMLSPLPKLLPNDGGHYYQFLLEIDSLEVLDKDHNLVGKYVYKEGLEIKLPKEYQRNIYLGPDAGFTLGYIRVLKDNKVEYGETMYQLEDDKEIEVCPTRVEPPLYFILHKVR